MGKKINKPRTIDQICHGLRILERYKPQAEIYGKETASCILQLQELEFNNITDHDRQQLLSLNWETNGHYLWWI